jgi:hypothetical protein
MKFPMEAPLHTDVNLPDPRWEAPELLYPGRKPVGNVVIDWNHPLARGLVGYWLGGDLQNYADGSLGTIVGDTGDVQKPITQWGQGWATGTTGTTDRIDLGSITSSNPLSLAGLDKATMISVNVVSTAYSADSFPRQFDKSDGGNGANGYACYFDGTDGFAFAMLGNNKAFIGATDMTATPQVVTNGLSIDMAQIVQSNKVDHYAEGIRTEGNSNAGWTTFPSTTTSASLLNWNHATSRANPYPQLVFALWGDRTFTGREQKAFHDNPYQFLIPA